MAISEKLLRKELIYAASALYERGMNSELSGNVSARLGNGRMLLTPASSAGILKGALTPNQLSVVAFNGELKSGPENSSEWRVHASIYASMPDVKAIVHSHPKYSLLFTMKHGVGMFNEMIPEACIRLGEAKYYLGYANEPERVGFASGKSGSQDLADSILAEIINKKVSIVVIEGHGTVAIGRSMAEALGRTEELERYAELSYKLLEGPG